MRQWIRQLASLKLTVVLLVFFVLVLAAGTLVESRLGTQAARAIYYAPWFLGLQILFGVNLVCAMIERWPWRTERIGFALTHAALLLILIGALATALFKQEGQLALWEGEESARFVNAYTPGEVTQFPLPFTVKLDAFEIDYYPGSRRPAQFRSRVQVDDPTRGAPFAAVIEMNHGLSYGGYDFFQSSYRQEAGREMTVLSVSRDRGQPVVFTGYVLLIIGMATVFFTRLSQRHRSAASHLSPMVDASSRPESPFNIVRMILWASILASGATAVLAQIDAVTPPSATVDAVRNLPVQHDGRTMPLDTLAREATWKVTGQRVWNGVDAVALVLGWTFDPEGWARQPIVLLDGPRLAAQTGSIAGSEYVSFAEVAADQALLGLMREARQKSQLDEPLSPLLAEAQELEGRLVWLQRFLDGSALRVVPSTQPGGEWSIPRGIESAEELAALGRQISQRPPDRYPSLQEMAREVRYNRVRANRIAWVILIIALLLALFASLSSRRALDHAISLVLMIAFAVMTWGLATRWQIAGRIPASNMYESMLFLGWGVALFAVVASVAIRNRLVVLNAAAVSALTMVLLDLLPMDPFIHPMPPVLTGTPWLAIHVPITMVSYSVFAVAVLVAHVQIAVDMFSPSRGDLVTRLGDLLYLYMHIGSILLAAGIFTGSIWAASSWGRYWGWDPKEVWSLIALLAYMAILHGRFDRLVGHFGTAALSILAFWTILMTYLGVNFILSAGLHSYGFGESSVTRWLVLAATVEAGFLIAATLVHLRRPEGSASLALTR